MRDLTMKSESRDNLNSLRNVMDNSYQRSSPILNVKLQSSPKRNITTPVRGISRGKSLGSISSSSIFSPSSKKRMQLSPSVAPSKNYDGISDRFIPDRSNFRVDLCRASVLSGEKRRKAAEREFFECEENGDTNSRSTPPSNSSRTRSNGDTLTPLETEFRRRMRSALLSLPMDDFGDVSKSSSQKIRKSSGGNVDSHSNGSRRDLNTSNGSLPSSLERSTSSYIEGDEDNLNLSTRSLGADLVYAPSPEADDEDPSDSIGPGHLGRLLSFKGSRTSSRSLSNSKTPSQSTPRHTFSSTSNIVTPSPPTRDPYTHDQLRVLHRSASERFSHSNDHFNLQDPFSIFEDDGFRSVAKKIGRKIPTTPSRILDAPELVDDYYLNLVTWGANNILAVALGQRVYLWNADSGDIHHLLTLQEEGDFVTSVSWSSNPGEDHMIAVGTNNSPVQVWDAEALTPVRTLNGHSARVGSLSWNQNYLSSGGRDSLIIQHDLRSRNHIVSTYAGHTQEVCGLKWNDDGTTLASGGNENYLCLWDAAMSRRNNSSHNNGGALSPRLLLKHHQAAVKALGWCPFHRGLLASGGGTADRTIKFWNTNSGAMLNSVDTGSQVCSLLWSKHNKELCSSHGFSENQLILWKYPGMTKIQEFTGHTARVLHMEQSPDGACVVSAAADETLRFWDIFGSPPSRSKNDSFALGNFAGKMSQIR